MLLSFLAMAFLAFPWQFYQKNLSKFCLTVSSRSSVSRIISACWQHHCLVGPWLADLFLAVLSVIFFELLSVVYFEVLSVNPASRPVSWRWGRWEWSRRWWRQSPCRLACMWFPILSGGSLAWPRRRTSAATRTRCTLRAQWAGCKMCWGILQKCHFTNIVTFQDW